MSHLPVSEDRSLGAAIKLVLTISLLVGAVLRMVPVSYGLPFIFHPDETFLITELGKFLGGIKDGSIPFGISVFHYPLTALYALYFCVGVIVGRIDSVVDIQNAFLLDDPALHLIGRLMGSGMSVVTVILTFVLGREAYCSRVGAVAALLTAVSLPEISGAHWLKQNAIVTLMVVGVTMALVRASRRDWLDRQPWTLGLLLGLALATRIDLAVVLPVFLVAVVAGSDGRPTRSGFRALLSRSVILTLAVAVLIHLVVSFQLAEVVLRNVMNQQSAFRTRGTGASLLEFLAAGDVMVTLRHNAWFYVSRGLVGTSGIVLTAFVAVGLVRATWSHRREELTLLVLVGLMSIQLLLFNVYGVHYLARFMPILMVFAASAIVRASVLVPPGIRTWGLIALVAAAAVQPTFYSLRYVQYVATNVDTRVRAREWIYQNIPFGTSLAVQKFDELPRYLPPLNEAREFAAEKRDQIVADSRGSGLAFQAKLMEYPRDTYPITNLSISRLWDSSRLPLENNYDFVGLEASGVRYIVTSSFNSPLMDEEADVVGLLISPSVLDRDAFAGYEEFMRTLPERASLVAEFMPRNRAVTRQTDSPIDPSIRIYRLP